MSSEEADRCLSNARRVLLAERNEHGHWEGELSTSALSTATAIVALGAVDEERHHAAIKTASMWLVEHQNDDGGWGDTVKSFSNVSTTLLCWSALTRFGGVVASESVMRAGYWVRDYVGSLDAGLIAETVKARYGKDRTFSVPILMMCSICGILGDDGWRHVMPLPFQLAVFPRKWFGAMRLPVVSYALPALIAIGYARFRQRRGSGAKLRRPHLLWPRLSKLLTSIQPASGGFLEAAPLTSFVTMALVAAGEKSHPVAVKGVAFLLDTVRPDGSWPIDTNLATWATTLSVKALLSSTVQQGSGIGSTLFDQREKVLAWLLGQQYREVHSFTNSPPGGWAWTDLSGGVPDADDTPGALLALRLLDDNGDSPEVIAAATAGISWLLGLQNRDGGMPTFCQGWGALPFDRSSPDLTAHALRAWHSWRAKMAPDLQGQIDGGMEKGLKYLLREQRIDGAWCPLWFGNQHRHVDEENPTYGTSLVVRSLDDIGWGDLADEAVKWLCCQQNSDGGWGSLRDETPSTIEETALAVSALSRRPEGQLAVEHGKRWLIEATECGTRFNASPIGFYFARLWYFERIYPVVWTVEAMTRSQDPSTSLIATAQE
tara:strand:- start:332 stop:2140 length:1809 start_codon:yes stop_codon:yes gene_type:complete